MADTKIEWTNKTWNPTRGCELVSPGCSNCYAMKQAHRFSAAGQPYHGLTKLGGRGPVWTGHVREVPEMLAAPLHWREPAKIFVDSMSDLFHEGVSNEYIAAVFGIMAACPHTFQILTKRAERLPAWFEWLQALARRTESVFPDDTQQWRLNQLCRAAAIKRGVVFTDHMPELWPLPNVHLGVSVESQQHADERIPHLLRTPVAVRFLSCEPLLGPLDVSPWLTGWTGMGSGLPPPLSTSLESLSDIPAIDWVIVGGESGPGARPMHPAWARSVRDQCVAAGVPFLFKQWGAWVPMIAAGVVGAASAALDRTGGIREREGDPLYTVQSRTGAPLFGNRAMRGRMINNDGDAFLVGKHAAGRLLDGRTWDEFPKAVTP